MGKEELDEILDRHKLWVETGGNEGVRANLQGANLQGANLEDASIIAGFKLTKE